VSPPVDPIRQSQLALAAKLGLPEGYCAEVLLESQLLSPMFIAATSEDKLLVAEHYGDRLLRIDPVTTNTECIYQLPHGAWDRLLSDGADGAYLRIRDHIAHIAGDGTYTKYSSNSVSPVALGPDGEIYCISFSRSDVLVIRDPDQKPETIATGFSNILDVVRAQNGTLYVSDWDRGTVTRIDPDGTKTVLPAAFNQKDPIDLDLAPDGTLYVNEGIGKFHKVDPKSGTLTTISWVGGREGSHPGDFTFISDGNAYFVDGTHNNLIRADFKTNKMDIVIVGQGNSRALDVGPDGAVYIGDDSGFPSRRARVLRIADGTVEVYADDLDLVTDLSFAPDSNLFVTTLNQDDGTSSALLITPKREVQTLARWDKRSPGFRVLWSVSVDPKTGLAIAYDKDKGQLISIDRTGNISTLPHSFHFATVDVPLAHAADGTLYAIEVNTKGFEIGPLVERNVICFDKAGHPEIVTDFNHIGSSTAQNLDIGPDGNIYALGYKLEGNDMCLWRITPDGKKTLLSDKLPIDPLAIATDAQGNIYLCCAAGLFLIYPA